MLNPVPAIALILIILTTSACHTPKFYVQQRNVEKYVKKNIALEVNIKDDNLKRYILNEQVHAIYFCHDNCSGVLNIDIDFEDEGITKFSVDLKSITAFANFTLKDSNISSNINEIIFSGEEIETEVYLITRDVYWSFISKEEKIRNQLRFIMDKIIASVYRYYSREGAEVINHIMNN